MDVWMVDETAGNGRMTPLKALKYNAIMALCLGGLAFILWLYDFPSKNPAVSMLYMSMYQLVNKYMG